MAASLSICAVTHPGSCRRRWIRRSRSFTTGSGRISKLAAPASIGTSTTLAAVATRRSCSTRCGASSCQAGARTTPLPPRRPRGPAPRGRRPRRGMPRLIQPRATGRWSLVADLIGAGANATERLHAEAGVLLQRHGVLTREAVVGEGWPGGFASLYPVLRAMEESGRIRRGYFVEGLGGSQFALPGAVDRLRSLRESGGAVIAMAATDPANAYGTVLSWPQSDGRMARAAGAYCVVDDGRSEERRV